MADFISRDKAANVLCMACGNAACDPFECSFYKEMEDVPAADVRPVARGKWTRVDYEPCGHDYICSECGCKSDGAWNFCQDCGADMREAGK